MPTLRIRGRTRAGQTVSGERAAGSRWTPRSPRSGASRSRSPGSPGEGRQSRPRRATRQRRSGKIGKKVAAKNLAVFTRQFSVMIDAGLPLVQCLDILGTQEEDKNFAAVILETRTSVESGASLADAMRKHPKTFDPLLHEHDRGGRGGRHPRHHSQAARDLHREGRQAGRPGQVGDDLTRSPSS